MYSMANCLLLMKVCLLKAVLQHVEVNLFVCVCLLCLDGFAGVCACVCMTQRSDARLVEDSQ